MKIKVLGDRVLVRLFKPADTATAGGIIMPSSVKQDESKGEVLAVGAGRLNPANPGTTAIRWPLEVKVGDTVVFSPTSGVEIDHHGEKLKVLSESEIFAVIGAE